ncbi:MAG: peptidylprolyl isomerase [Polaribacter sp.]|nr:peptidylprolyl isomerase [Polaribacter sp.]
MKTRIVTIFFFAFSMAICSQKNTDVLFEVEGTPVFVSEFKKVYEKNIELVADERQKELKNYLELYINYKLKLKQAYHLKLDTIKAYKREVETYKTQLISSYLQDTSFLATQVKEAYFRTKHQIRARHILIKLNANASPQDTLKAYQKIIKARNEIISGKPFARVASIISDDRSAKNNGGDLGYFTAFKMVYSFENKVYQTKIGEISMPFRTRFGYHIAKVIDLKVSKGELEVAHILIADTTVKGKYKIDSIYDRLQKGDHFNALAKLYSNDRESAKKGGRLPKFGIGMMVKPFEEAAFSIPKEAALSKPFKTRYGWHLIKLLKRHPVKPFSELKAQLAHKIKNSDRARLSDLAVLNRLKSEYKIVVNKPSKAVFLTLNRAAVSRESLQNILLTIQHKKIKQVQFFDYIKNRKKKSIELLFNDFVDQEVVAYFKESLIHTNPVYAAALKEYEEGLLLFELMQQKIWNKSMNDSLGLKAFFVKNKTRYSFNDLSKNKGAVMDDYQTYLEDEWVQALKRRYTVKIRKRTVDKLLKSYLKND